MQAAIKTRSLRRNFAGIEAVCGIDLLVPAGTIYGFLGPNGAGKSTTIRLLTGLLRPSSGSISILGVDVANERLRAAKLVGSLVETPSLYEHLTGRENLEITRLLLRLAPSSIDRTLELVDLRWAADRRVSCYSLGMKQRLALGRAMLADPRVLILDEPGNGLDPDGLRDLRDMLMHLAEEGGITVLVSSHQLAEVQQVASHIGVMSHGRLLAQGPVADVLGSALHHVEIRADRPAQVVAILRSRQIVANEEHGSVHVDVGGDPDTVSEIINHLVSAGIRLAEVRCRAPSLEDLYVRLTGKVEVPPSLTLAS